MNHTRSKIQVTMDHGNMTPDQFKAILEKLAKAAKGKSQRMVRVECGDFNCEK